MPMLTRDGVQLHFEVHGDGPVVLLTHGYTATCRMWDEQVDALSADHTLVTWDLRGHGHSDAPADPAAYHPSEVVADMAALLDHVGAGPGVVGGMSLGGYLTLEFARRHPERLAALLIIDSGPGFKRDGAREGWNAMARDMADRIEAGGADYLSHGTAERRRSAHDHLEGVVLAGRHMLVQRDDAVMRSIPDIGVPTLVVVGADDEPFLAGSEYMAAKIPDAELVVIDEAGHAANIDQPGAFNDAVRAFLDRHRV